LGGPKSATDYSRDITAREVNLATGAVRSWSLGRDFAAVPVSMAPVQSQSPAAYLIGMWGVPDLGIYTFPGTGPVRISGPLQKQGPLGQVINGLEPDFVLAPNRTVFDLAQHDVVQLNLDGAVVDRWPIPTPIPGAYSGPSARGKPDGHSLFGFSLALDSAGAPFVWATNGLNAVLVDLKRGKRTDFAGLGFARGIAIRADGKAFTLSTSFEPVAQGTTTPFCGPGSNYCFFKSTSAVVEFDMRTMQVTARYPMPTPNGSLLIGRSSVHVVQVQDTYTTLLTLDERHGTFIDRRIPLGAWGLSVAFDWTGNVYFVSHPSQEDLAAASGGRVSPYQDRLTVFSAKTGKTSEAVNALRPPAGQEVLGFLFRS
jgi:hypothetical protein